MNIRVYERFQPQLKWRAELIVSKHGSVDAIVRRMSMSGAYLETEGALNQGAKIILLVKAQIREEVYFLKVCAEVKGVSVLSNCNSQGVWLKYVALTAAQRKQLAQMVEA